MQYPAHIRESLGSDAAAVQTVEEHCGGVSAVAEQLLKPIGLGKTGELIGMLHDLGKFTTEFKNYIEQASRGENPPRGSVNHTFAGVRLLFEQFHGEECETMEDMACEILSAAIGSHHGLFDCIGARGEDGFIHRLKKELPAYKGARNEFLKRCMNEDKLGEIFSHAVKEISAYAEIIGDISTTDDEVCFHLSLLCRLLTSALVDADRRDTAEFMNGIKLPPNQKEPWTAALDRVEKQISNMKSDGDVNRARRMVSDTCKSAAGLPDGIHRLSVPTGGGKTLTALRYALTKAKNTGKQRIFFVIPLLSVLEQNAKVIHSFVGDDSLILEHHSNIVQERNTEDELDNNELLMETWNAPIVITTLVQLLNTLFSGSTSCIRRMQALANSVIVIDEVQSVPLKLMSLFNLAMNFLSKLCGAEIVLCSATQPCLEKMTHGIIYEEPAELVPWSDALWQPFHRTRIIDKRKPGGYTMEEMVEFSNTVLENAESLLIICNLKQQAKTLYNMLSKGNATVFHLSASMCMEHRKRTLDAINDALERTRTNPESGEKVICVSTQVAEAGIDFSFGSVIRIIAGMDNAVQSAGRCNRNGEKDWLCPVYIIEARDENLGPLKEISRAQNATKNLLEAFAKNSIPYGGDLASSEAVRFYYSSLFGTLPLNAPDFVLPKLSTSIYELLSDNGQFGDRCETFGKHTINQAFKTAGEHFMVFDENTTDVLVPYGRGAECIADLNSERAKYDAIFCAKTLKKAKPYTVSLYENQIRRIKENGGLYTVMDGAVFVLCEGFYDNETGATPDGGANTFMGV